MKHSSAYKGVSWARKVGRWRSEIRVRYELIFLGYFDDEVAAARAYDAASIKYRGDRARVNFK
jgi:hypothetical protein